MFVYIESSRYFIIDRFLCNKNESSASSVKLHEKKFEKIIFFYV